MNHAVWLTAWLLPAAVGMLAMSRWSAAGRALMPWAAVPAAALALWPADPDPAELPWLLLGTRFDLDAIGRVFLAMTALLWTAAAWYGRTYMQHAHGRRAYWGPFGLCMSGNLGLIMTYDLVTFYMAFAVMTLAGYALVMHRNDSEARHAGRIYIIMAILGEVVLVAGLMFAAHAAGGWRIEDLPAAVADSPWRDLIVALIFIGFGVKAGALGLHMWLPLAHPAAPTPASAVLSGTMIKAGLLGWLRVLPIGEAAMPVAGGTIMMLGLAAAFLGVAVGAVQTNAKTVLAYSSVSQMGLMIIILGMALSEPTARELALAALAVYALHHGLAKGALFLSVGVAQAPEPRRWQRWALMVGIALSAAALAGAPMTSGQIAKHAMKEMTPLVAEAWYRGLSVLLPATAIATTLLMARFLWLIWPRRWPEVGRRRTADSADTADVHPGGPGMWWSWLSVVALLAVAVWWAPAYLGVAVPELTPWSPAELWHAGMPVVVGGVGVWAAARWGPPVTVPWIPAGDAIWLLHRAIGLAGRGWRLGVVPMWRALARRSRTRWNRLMLTVAHRTAWLELRLMRWATAGAIFVLVMLLLMLTAQWGR